MGLFRKKETKTREIREDDSTFIKLWYNPRTHAMMELGAFLIFFAILIIIAKVGSNSNKVNGKDNNTNLVAYLNNLDDKVITYNFEISDADDVSYFSGIRDKEGQIIGQIMHNIDTTYILVNNNVCKAGTYSEGVFFEDETLTCPDNINYELFDYKNLIDIINKPDVKIKNYTSYYSFVYLKRIYKVFTSGKLVNKIEVTDGSDTYVMKYFVNAVEPSDNIENIENIENETINEE